MRLNNYTSAAILGLALITFSSFKLAKPGADNDLIYQKGRVFNYKIIYVDKNGRLKDSSNLKLVVGEGNFKEKESGEQNIKYTYTDCFGIDVEESKGVLEKNGKVVSLRPPSDGCFQFVEFLPFAKVTLPITAGFTDVGIHKVRKDVITKLKCDPKAKFFRRVEDKTIYSYKGQTIDCWRITGKNTSHLSNVGTNRCSYLFNENYGFVSMHFLKEDGSEVWLELRGTNF